MMGEDTSDPRPYHHGDLRRALLDAAEQLIGERGPERVSLRAIARAAGVSHAAPYHHFEDLDDLLATVAASGFARLRDAMLERAAAFEGPPLARLQEAGVSYVRFASEHPELYRLMFGGHLRLVHDHDELTRTSEAAYAALGVLLARAGDAEADEAEFSDVRAGDLAAGRATAARAAWATVYGLSMLLIDGRLDVDASDAAAVEELAREVTGVLGPGLRRSG